MSFEETDTNSDFVESLLGDFLDESDQLLTRLNANLLQLDEWVQSLAVDHQQHCDENLLNEMFRAAHSLKGLSAMLGFTEINRLTHKIENVFDAARRNQLSISRNVTELIFQALDHLAAMVGQLKDPGGNPVDCNTVQEAILRLLQDAGAEQKPASQADAERALGASIRPDSRPSQAEAILPEAAQQPDPLEGIADESDIPDHHLSLFADEAETSLDALTVGLLALEGGRSADDLNHLLGTAHKIKGSAACIGLRRAARLAHWMEDLLEEAVAAEGTLPAPTIDVLLKCTDGLRQHVADLRCNRRGSDQLGPLARDLLAARQGAAAPAVDDRPAISEQRQAEPAGVAPARRTTYRGEVVFHPRLPAAGLKALLIREKLAKLGDVLDCQPSLEQLEAIDRLDCFRFRITTDQPAESVAGPLHIGGVVRVSVTPFLAEPVPDGPEAPRSAGMFPAQKPATEAGPPSAAAGQRPAETVRVDTERLDQLMDLAGQLVINRAQFSQIGQRLKAVADCNHAVRALGKLSGELERLSSGQSAHIDGQHAPEELESMRGQIRRIWNDLAPICREVQTLSRARDSVRELFEAIHQLDRVSDGIQKSVMDLRMVPIGPLFARFHRVVRDIARASGKLVRLEIAGEKTELDKHMIDELGDPLVHLVRNSADHGIESPEEREAAGKPRQGTVTLEAFHRGNNIVIEVRDDGKGLDTDSILRKALDKGLVAEADAQRMTPYQIQQLIWKPGLSTAEKVTDISGRGMGMDIVKTKIEELSGTVEISSERGKGTTITLKLPLTLAILPSLMVDIAGGVFAMPMEAVTEIVSVERSRVRVVGGRPVATVRGRVVPLVKLGDALCFQGDGAASAGRATETTLVVLGDAGQELGLAVDRVIGEEDVVIKSIAENYANVRGIAGASILGDGRVALILDVPALIAAVCQMAASSAC